MHFLAIDWNLVLASVKPMLDTLISQLITQPIFTLLGTVVGTLAAGIGIQIYKAIVGKRWEDRVRIFMFAAEKLGMLNKWTGPEKKQYVINQFKATTKRGILARILHIFPPALIDAFIEAMVTELFPKEVPPVK